MPEPVAAALLIAVAIAYLVGAVLLVATLAKVLLTWLTSQRTGRAAAPVDDALQQRAETAMAVVGSSRTSPRRPPTWSRSSGHPPADRSAAWETGGWR